MCPLGLSLSTKTAPAASAMPELPALPEGNRGIKLPLSHQCHWQTLNQTTILIIQKPFTNTNSTCIASNLSRYGGPILLVGSNIRKLHSWIIYL